MSIKLAMELVFSAREDGGGTFDKQAEPYTGPGYVVGGRVPSLVVSNKTSVISLVEAVAAWIDKNKAHFYGSWLNEGLIHIDAVDIRDSLADALALGRERGEIAVYDLVDGQEVFISG